MHTNKEILNRSELHYLRDISSHMSSVLTQETQEKLTRIHNDYQRGLLTQRESLTETLEILRKNAMSLIAYRKENL